MVRTRALPKPIFYSGDRVKYKKKEGRRFGEWGPVEREFERDILLSRCSSCRSPLEEGRSGQCVVCTSICCLECRPDPMIACDACFGEIQAADAK